MDWYCKLVGLLIDDENRSKILRDELEKQIVELYKRLLLYQMKSVCRYYRSQILVLLGDVFKIDDWTGELAGVQEAEDQVRARLGQYQSSSIRDSLKTLAGAMQHQTNQIQDLSSLIQKQNQAQQDRDKHRDRENCLIDFRQKVDPHHEKDRIQIEKGGLLRDAYSWVLDHVNYRRWREEIRHNILWIKGDPGKGKTMLLCGIIDELEMDPTQTLSYFFCQATETTLNSATAVLRGLIYGLAKRYSQVDRYIYEKYKDGGGKAVFEGDSAWVVMCGILKAILDDPMMNGVLLIVDALDECVEGRQKLLDFICERSNSSPLSLELNSDLVAHAVRTYIQRRVDKLAEKQPYHDDLELRSHVEEYLNKNSSDTFLWVALVCDALRQDNILRRAHVIGPKGVLRTFPKGLDKLYKRMFQYISGTMDADLCKDVLAVTAILKRSVTSLELCSIMGLSQYFDGKVETLQDAVRCCGSFLSLRDGIVYFVHQSAQDFLLNKEVDAFDSLFPDGVEDVHWAVCLRSMDAVSKIVRRDIYELQDVGVARSDITVLNPDPLASVAYSCAYWMKHLEESNPATNIKDDGTVDEFLQSKFLYWLEALALLGELTQAVRGIQKLQHVIRGKSSLNNKSLADLVHDANRFLLYHKEMIAEFPLQIYETALLFSPEESIVRKLFFEDHAPEWISIMPGLDMTWDEHLQSLPGHESSINTAVYSPDGQWILSTSEDGTVKLWQADSGNCELRYGGFGEGLHSWSNLIAKAGVGSAAFLGDSHTFTAASWNGVIKVWNLKTNQVEIFRGHEEVKMATTMAISPDGRTFAYGLENRVIHIWNMDKKTSARISMASNADVHSLSFTTDGRWLVSVGRHDVIRIWNSSTGECKKEIIYHGAYYPDCQEIATWGRSAGNEVEVQKFHSDNVSIMTMSKDHRQIASASSSGQVTIWETKTGARTYIFDADSVDAKGDNRGDNIHEDDESGSRRGEITSLAFRNSLQLACGSWETIRILNISDGTTAQTHHEADILVNLMEVATDGQWLAYRPFRPGAEDHHVHSFRIWNTATEKCLTVPDSESMYGHITSLSFSMDGQLLASSSHRSIRLWDVTTGRCIRIIRRLNTQFGFLTIENSGPGCLGPSSLDVGNYGDTEAAAQGLEKAPYAEDSRESSWLDFCGYGFSTEFDWLVLDGRRLLRIPPDYRANRFSKMTPIINQSALIWISVTGRLVRLYFPSRG
ncbi:hypothetical protein CLIM01_07134 [Colletotrichum limetticola]|uniref:NACHT domain-containing protein n=1 Tax=Colletotrichum limetticola TaxID=1209924 RepID=A0ABQ9PVH0_9PEZI|nr:hypothetical protein CLIM01_07134 [Colletotrichum limetticola]